MGDNINDNFSIHALIPIHAIGTCNDYSCVFHLCTWVHTLVSCFLTISIHAIGVLALNLSSSFNVNVSDQLWTNLLLVSNTLLLVYVLVSLNYLILP